MGNTSPRGEAAKDEGLRGQSPQGSIVVKKRQGVCRSLSSQLVTRPMMDIITAVLPAHNPYLLLQTAAKTSSKLCTLRYLLGQRFAGRQHQMSIVGLR